MDFIANMIKTLNIITALFIGFYYFRQGLITAGSFILLFSAIMKINNELHYLIYNYREFNKALVDVEKYLSILEEVPLVKDPEINTDIKDVDTRIELKNVTFNYPGNTNNVFKNLNLTINSNEKIALVGKSGAGKTTIVTLLLRFYDVVSGGIYIDGINVKNFKKKDLRSLFGIVPQDPIMFNDTIKYNICYGKQKASMSEIIQACKTANIYDFIESLPEKFDTQVGERGIKLSGGQKQRLAIARVVLSNPKIIVFDEATSQLDSESEKEIQDAFWKIAQTKTTIIIAHRLSTVIHADRIIVFDKGKIIESGNHKDLTELKGIYYKLWKIQSSNISDNIPA
ncbi:MAG: ATP-binding cassette domain-containing protein [Candidatus Pacebacteria bacterium]|nr:ATP-binding cassette domain-containing protein [Candidatus Paceibacterota bacterium]